MLNMTEIAKLISNDAKILGINKGDTILVHSSLKSLGVKEATPKDVIDGLVDALNAGTLVFPTLSYLHCNSQNREFNYYTTPSNVGAIPEFFRTQYEGAIRSLCPTHSCAAVGENAEYITKDHHLDNSPCGEHSPFRKIMLLGGKILFLGCGSNCNTSMHAVEELIEPDYLFSGIYEYNLTGRDGKVYSMNCKAHGFKGVRQCYYRVVNLLDKDEYAQGNILNAECFLLHTVPMWKKAEAKYRENQHYFIDYI